MCEPPAKACLGHWSRNHKRRASFAGKSFKISIAQAGGFPCSAPIGGLRKIFERKSKESTHTTSSNHPAWSYG